MKRAAIIVLSALVSTASFVHADETSEAQQRAETIRPWLDEQTIAVVRMDLTRIDREAFWAWFRRVLQRDKPLDKFETLKFERLTSRIDDWFQEFSEAGGRDLYVVFSLNDLGQRPPFVIATVREGGDPKTIASLLISGRKEGFTSIGAANGDGNGSSGGRKPLVVAEPHDDVVFAGPAESFQRLKASQSARHPGFVRALQAARDAPVQLLVLPSDDHRQVLDELVLALVPQLGENAGRVLSEGLRWMAVGIDLPPRTAVNVIVQSKNPEAAAAMKTFVAETVLPNVLRIPEVRKVLPLVPESDRLAELLTPQVEENRLVLRLDETSRGIDPFLNTIRLASDEIRSSVLRDRRMTALKQIAIAMHNYHDVHSQFPPAYSTNKDGKALLSWRVLILPYLGRHKLYKEFHLDEPWDSEHNRTLISRMPSIYGSRGLFLANEGQTTFLAPVGEGLAFEGNEPVPIKEFTDGTSNTILVVDAAKDSVAIWTKPADLPVDQKDPLKGLVDEGAEGFLALTADGAAHFIEKTMDPVNLWRLFTRAGGEPVSW